MYNIKYISFKYTYIHSIHISQKIQHDIFIYLPPQIFWDQPSVLYTGHATQTKGTTCRFFNAMTSWGCYIRGHANLKPFIQINMLYTNSQIDSIFTPFSILHLIVASILADIRFATYVMHSPLAKKRRSNFRAKYETFLIYIYIYMYIYIDDYSH